MGKIKFTKGELKRQRDALKQFERYLPTLQLKKQQLQMEIMNQRAILEEQQRSEAKKRQVALAWAGLLNESAGIRDWVLPLAVQTDIRNIAGVDIPVFDRVEYKEPEYDLFSTPLWVDGAVEALRALVMLGEHAKVLKNGIEILRYELRITTQRLNLFEKVKIPQAQEAIRRIKIYLGDQTTNAVGRSKIAKRKIELWELQEVGV